MNKIILAFVLVFSTATYAADDHKLITDNEKNTVSVFQSSVKSVVHVSSLKKVRRSFFDINPIEVPAGTGTGFVWEDGKHIVTNFHVVQGSNHAIVTFHKDGKEYKAKVVGVAPSKDVAVLELAEDKKELLPIKLANSDQLTVGQKTMAIGNPFGLDYTITEGIISALGRKIEGIGGVTINGIIQTDASINPGNSGGPLLNSSGEVIGMNTMIISPSGSSAGIGFAIPINEVKRAVPQLIQYGKMIRPILGIQPLSVYYKERFGVQTGLVIREVFPDGPAAKIGLKGIDSDRYGRYFVGDVIVEMDGQKIDDYDDYFQIMDKKKFGDKLKIKILREGKEKNFEVELTKVPELER